MTNRFFSRSTPWTLIAPLAVTGLLAGCGGGGGGGSDSGSTSIQGVIGIESGSRIDSDYADLWRANGMPGNELSGGPVSLSMPATVGGYLSHATGVFQPLGLAFPRDDEDQYQVSLEDGDRYLLQCFPSAGGDVNVLDVSLALDVDEKFNGNACGSGGTVSAVEAGNATITISTSAGGPFRYVLTISPQGVLSTSSVAWPEPPLKVDEAIVTGPGPGNVDSLMASSGLRASSVMDVTRSIGPDTWQVSRKAGVNALAAKSGATNDPRAETIDWIRGMREEFGLKAEPNYLFSLSTPSGTNPLFDIASNDWHHEEINVPGAWSVLAGEGKGFGLGVGVAVLDTGMFSFTPNSYGNWHEDLANNIVSSPPDRQLDFVSSAYDVDGQDGRDNVPGTPTNPINPGGTSYHGTHVAGIIGAEDNNSGSVGIAYQSTIWPYRVLGVDPVDGEDGTGTASDLVAAINHAAGQADVDVINLSLGGLPQIDALQAATDNAYDAGILVVAAGGNSASASAVYPAANYRVIGVGATDPSGSLASYSNYGQSVDLLAPGGAAVAGSGVINAYGPSDDNPPSYYAELAGTSMAAPHVTGVYALRISAGDIGPDQFRAQMVAGLLTDQNSPWNNYALYGAGLLDAEKALNSGTRNDFPTVISAWPRVVELSPSGSATRVRLEVISSGMAVPGVGTFEEPEGVILTDDAGNPIASGQLPEVVRISLSPDWDLSSRPLGGDIELDYTGEGGVARTLVIPVYAQAQDTTAQRNAGRHYVLLLDITNFDSAKSQAVLASYNSGRYQYSFNNVASGDYILVAGTDLDNNGFICENGEACAEYPRAGSRQVISVRGGEALRRDMTTSFRRPSIAEMGLPRYGFEGYPVPDRSTDDPAVDKQLR